MNVSQLCIDVNYSTSPESLPIKNNIDNNDNNDRVCSENSKNENKSIERHPIPSLAEFTYVNNSNQHNIYQDRLLHSYHSQPLFTQQYQQQSSTFCQENVNNIEQEDDDNLLLKQVIEQCAMIHTEISRYRVDPLTEADRNKIVDLVYYTTDTMMNSLKTIDQKLYPLNQQTLGPSFIPPTCPKDHEKTNSSKHEMIRQARNLKDNMRPKYRRRNRRSMIGQRCHSCNTTETPEWRRGPDGARTLCNACGLHYSKLLRRGSLTVQTHNYLFDSPSETKNSPKIIQFPIVQVQTNHNEPSDGDSSRKLMDSSFRNNNKSGQQ